jgi:5-bromo-4-chloroindolyl phosphate hydrolysis protein
MLEITASEYAEVRRQPRRFAVAPGHLYPEVERVVGEFGAYMVVEKTGAAGEVAEALAATETLRPPPTG